MALRRSRSGSESRLRKKGCCSTNERQAAWLIQKDSNREGDRQRRHIFNSWIGKRVRFGQWIFWSWPACVQWSCPLNFNMICGSAQQVTGTDSVSLAHKPKVSEWTESTARSVPHSSRKISTHRKGSKQVNVYYFICMYKWFASSTRGKKCKGDISARHSEWGLI